MLDLRTSRIKNWFSYLDLSFFACIFPSPFMCSKFYLHLSLSLDPNGKSCRSHSSGVSRRNSLWNLGRDPWTEHKWPPLGCEHSFNGFSEKYGKEQTLWDGVSCGEPALVQLLVLCLCVLLVDMHEPLLYSQAHSGQNECWKGHSVYVMCMCLSMQGTWSWRGF